MISTSVWKQETLLFSLVQPVGYYKKRVALDEPSIGSQSSERVLRFRYDACVS